MMAKSGKKPAEITWNNSLDADAVREAFAEATVDAYGDSEQHTSLYYTIEEQLVFPFPARVLGETVSVVGVEWPEGDEFGIDLICERKHKSYSSHSSHRPDELGIDLIRGRKGEQHRVEARSVELLEPLPDGHLFLAAYLAWKRFV